MRSHAKAPSAACNASAGTGRRALLLLGLSLSLCALALASASSAQASKVLYDSFCVGTAGTAGGQCNTPRGVAVNVDGSGGAGAGDVYVVDSSNHRIQQFTAKGAFIRAFGRDVVIAGKPNDTGTGFEICDTTAANAAADCKAGVTSPAEGGTLSSPQGIAVDQATGNLYVSNQEMARVEVFDATGHFLRAFGQDVVSAGPGSSTPTAAKQTLTVDATEGQLKLSFRGQTSADVAFNATAAQVDAALEALSTIGAGNVAVTGGPGGPGGLTPYLITFAGALANAPMPQIATSPGTTPLAGGAGASVANTTTGATGYEVCVAPADTCKAGLSAATAGAFATTFSGHLAVAPAGTPNAGNVLVADPGNRRVNEYTSSGAFVRSFGFDVVASPPNATATFEICRAADFDVCKAAAASGSAVGQFATNGPNRVAVDSTGAIYTVEATANFRVQKFTPSGANLVPSLFSPQIGVSPAVFLSGTSNSGREDDAPSDVAIGAADRVFVVKACSLIKSCPGAFPPNTAGLVERRVYEFDSAGNLLDTHLAGAAITGANGFAANPASGALYLSTFQSANFVTRFSVAIATEPPTAAPLVATGPTGAGPTAHHVALTGTVNPNGFKPNDCHFEYGPSSEYGSIAPCSPAAGAIGDGSAEVPVSAITEPLDPETVYHYRLFASNPGQGGQGKDRTFATGPAPADECANAAVRAAQGIEVMLLPDCLALEQVSPSEKANQNARFTNYPAISGDGNRVLFNSVATIGECPNVNGFGGDPIIGARQGTAAWGIECVQSPQGSMPGARFLPESFSPDLSSWFQSTNLPQIFRLARGTAPVAMTPPLSPQGGTNGPVLRGASADHSHIYFKPEGGGRGVFYLEGDPVPAGTGRDFNYYVAQLDPSGEPVVELLARDLNGKVWGGNCGARLGGMESTQSGTNLLNGDRNQGAISVDGSRVYLSTRPSQPATGNCVEAANRKRIMVREETPGGPAIEELVASECATIPRACPGEATGNITSGSKIVTNFSPTSPAGSFAPGMILTRIGATGIPANTKVAQVLSPSELELTAAATATAAGATLRANDGDDAYQGASVDQSKVYFTTSRQLLGTDLDGSSAASSATAGATSCNNNTAVSGCDLYLYDLDQPVGQRLTQVSLGEEGALTPGSGASVRNSITAISADGSHVYFVARTVLTDDANPAGNTAQPAQNNLYLYRHDEQDLSFVGVLATADGGTLLGSSGSANWENGAYAVPISGTDSEGNEVGGDGHVLLFRSVAPLLPSDADSAGDLYRYDAEAGTLDHLSAAAPGGSDDGSAGVVVPSVDFAPGADYAIRGRWASDDGLSVAFTTTEALFPADTNGAEDSYLWRDGQLYHLPGATRFSDKAREIRPLVSADGSTIAYHTTKRLTFTDTDSAEDVYVLRPGAGTLPVPRSVCSGEACQGAPTPGPGQSGAITNSFAGAGSVPPEAKRRCPKGKRKVRRAGKARCVKRQSKHKRRAAQRRAGAKQGGSK
ncbi:MAG TPA: hypothetical protein VFY04_07080 [Solirubrobacterales bacterium]|nr:hypothetical protein [Solirubrobacterales bacterium]